MSTTPPTPPYWGSSCQCLTLAGLSSDSRVGVLPA